MTDGGSTTAEEGEWIGLLAETRNALGSLRVEDLERLSVRAETMLSAIKCGQAGGINPSAAKREHHLLAELLRVTGGNLEVARRTRGGEAERSRTGRGLRWVR